MSCSKSYSEGKNLRRLPGESLEQSVARMVKAHYLGVRSDDSAVFNALIPKINEQRFQMVFNLIVTNHLDLPCNQRGFQAKVRLLVVASLKKLCDNQTKPH